MLQASMIFFVLGLLSLALGLTGFAGMAISTGKILLTGFVILAVISFIVGQIRSEKRDQRHLSR